MKTSVPARKVALSELNSNKLLDGFWGEYLGDAVYGALDGTVTTFAVIAGAVGAQLALPFVIIMAIANLLADGFSMSMGSFISQRSQKQFLEREKAIIATLHHDDPAVIEQMLTTAYAQKGLVSPLVNEVVTAIMKKPETVQNEIIAEKRVLSSSISPMKSAMVTFFSFVLVGFLPVIPILVLPSVNFWIVLLLVAIVLFAIGSLRSKITAVSWWRGGLEIMVAGLLASLIAFGVGHALSSFLLIPVE